jgi:predicted nucleotidyltransferase
MAKQLTGFDDQGRAWIFPVGTQVVTRKDVQGANGRTAHPAGAVGIVTKSFNDQRHSYRVRFLDGFEASLRHEQLVLLSEYKDAGTNELASTGLFERVIYRCVIGSRAYGLEEEGSDTDRRGIYLPTASSHWSLYGVPEQLEDDATQEVYWELQKFISLALKANPNILECLYSPIVEAASPLAEELLKMKDCFLSKLVFQTYSGYTTSQFRKMQADIRNQGQVKWKHVMHLLRLLISGIHVLREGVVSVRVDEHRDQLLAIRRGEWEWKKTEAWRRDLQDRFREAFDHTRLPDRPDYERANEFLIKARQLALEDELP